MVALWGGNSVAVSFSVDSIPPVAVACLRFAMGTGVMFLWCRWFRIPLRASRRELRVSFVAGFLLFTQIATFNVGVLWTNSTHGAMLINTFPFFVAAIEHGITKTYRLTTRRSLGLIIAAAGVAAVMFDRPSGSALPRSFLQGDTVLLVSSILLALRVVYVGRVVQTMQPGKLMFWHDVFGVLMFAAWSLAAESFDEVNFSWPSILGLLYQGLIVSGFCFVVHASLLKHHGASQISVFSFATPVFGVLFGVAIRNDPFTASIVVGATCVAAGIWAVTR